MPPSVSGTRRGVTDSVRGFRKFLLQGNLVSLAVAVVVGVAFNAVVQALIKDLITPLITAVGGQPNFSALQFSLHHSVFAYGAFVNSALSFLIIAAVVYFLVVAPANRLTELIRRNDELTEKECPECISRIPVNAKRCMYCTTVLVPAKINK